LLSFLAFAGLAAAHGMVDYVIIDGTKYPSFDPRVDIDFPGGVKRISWGWVPSPFTHGTEPVENVASPDVACRKGPLIDPVINAVARAGSDVTFQWTPWFGNHKGPVLTYMGLLPDEKTKVQEVDFFKVDEDGYDPKTTRWGTDHLVNNNSTRTFTIPSDIKPGNYVIRHELIGLHFAWHENNQTQQSGAQLYPVCFKVKVTGTGTATPPGKKFPGTYNWRDPGILINTKYTVNKYIVPGGPVYKGEKNPPQGPVPVVTETGELSGERAEQYIKVKTDRGKALLSSVANDIRDHKDGEGGCLWEEGADPSTAKCTAVNPGNPAYAGYAQPVGSPLYVATPGSAMRGQKTPPTSFYNTKIAVEFNA